MAPSQFGFKDVINQWKAEKWEPEKLMALYKRAGAQYFLALASHHDNWFCCKEWVGTKKARSRLLPRRQL